ncbi:MAG: cell division protein ZapA [Acidobacteria bacterium]|nr:cell division protein ZapA [Acidobacteriota bacterium]
MTLTTAVSVNIYNQPYNLRASGDGEYVKRIAEYVDRRMQEISEQTHVVDYGKVAVLAALNIADELHRVRQAYERGESSDAATPEQQSAHGTQPPESSPPGEEETKSRIGWNYADIFEELPEKKEGGDRISQQVASKLRDRS